MWLLRCVNDLMPTQSARLPETLAAYFADEWLCARMHRHVSCEVVVRVEDFPTFGTGESLIALLLA